MVEPRTIDPTALREYDVRGIVGATLSAPDIRALACAFASVVVRRGGRRIVVGYDGRLSSPDLEAAAVEGLSAAGVTVIRIGLGPSPMLYFAVRHLDADAGLMVTGSHNPVGYNGLKFSLRDQPFFADAIQALGRAAATGDFERGSGTITQASIGNAYVDRLVTDLAPGRPLNIAWDPGHGACAAVLADLCKRFPGAHFLINNTVDGTFPAHHPDPTVEANLAELKALVAEHGCDAGIAFDGDGDRIGVIDGSGRVVWGDQLLVLLARQVLAEQPGAAIIADVKSSQVFFDEITKMGGRPLMGRTGHSPMKQLMAETGAVLAGEISGHIFFAQRYYGFDDGLYAAVRLLELLGQSQETLVELVDALPAMVNTPEIRFACDDVRKFAVVREVKARLQGEHGVAIDDTDGVRVSTTHGWWLLRPSNTQPALVGRCESSSTEGLRSLEAQLFRHLQACGVDPAQRA